MTRSSVDVDRTLATLGRLLYNHNPFYLIGTLLFLVGVQQTRGGDPDLAASGTLVGLLVGYTLLLAGIAVIVIRFGKIWEDARTILLVIVLLFFMLSAGLDLHLLEEPISGSWLLVGGLVFSLGLSEGLLRVLEIHLAARYRVPFYSILVLLFLYPVALAWLSYYERLDDRAWALYAFPAIASALFLGLLPAARTRARHEPPSGTPWIWPYYPWSLFVFLTIGVAIRAWWLTVSFEIGKGVSGSFQPYFLMPLCVAWGVLMLEIGRTRRHFATLAFGLVLPLFGLAISFPGYGNGAVQIEFQNRLMAGLGSPAQIAVFALLAFYSWAWLRKVRLAEGFLVGTLLVAALISATTIDLSSLVRPQSLPLAAAAGLLLATAFRKQSTWRAIAGATVVLVGLHYSGLRLASDVAFWQWHLPVLALLVTVCVFDDSLARVLRNLAWPTVPALAIVALTYPWLAPNWGDFVVFVYLLLLLGSGLLIWRRLRTVEALNAVCATACAVAVSQLRTVYAVLEPTKLGDGLPWLAGGAVVVAVAVGISLFKMGLGPWAERKLVWLNSVGERW